MVRPIFTKCCCCSLRTAGLILGWYSVVVGFISVHVIGFIILMGGCVTWSIVMDLVKIGKFGEIFLILDE